VNTIDRFRHLRLPLGWDEVRAAWEGWTGARLLSLEDVVAVADDRLVTASARELPLVADLSLARDDGQVARLLEELSPDLPRPDSPAIRALVCVHLSSLLEELDNDPVRALPRLASFWASVGNPAWSPFVPQGVAPDITPPGQYYTSERLRSERERHARWLAQEIDNLRTMSRRVAAQRGTTPQRAH
jgi:hypothetical protein